MRSEFFGVARTHRGIDRRCCGQAAGGRYLCLHPRLPSPLRYSHRLDSKGFGGFTLYNDENTIFRSGQKLVFQFNMSGVDIYLQA
jgi:hypothetical protein